MGSPMIAMKAETAAAALDMSVDEFFEAVKDCDIPMPVMIGKHVRWLARDLDGIYDEAHAALVEAERDRPAAP